MAPPQTVTRRGLCSQGGGILGLTAACYIAASSDSCCKKKLALQAMTTAFAAWGANNAYRAVTKGSTQSKIDTGITAVLAAFTGSALM